MLLFVGRGVMQSCAIYMAILWLSSLAHAADAIERNYDALVLSLKNANTPPTMATTAPVRNPLFPLDYDWNEQRRIRLVIQELVDGIQAAWPSLVKHLDDAEYCITVDRDGLATNLTIGGVCYLVITDSLAAPYRPFIPDTKTAHLRLEVPAIAKSKEFKQWCEMLVAQREMLYDTQSKMCEWATVELHGIVGLTDADKVLAQMQITAMAAELRRTKQPICAKEFIVPDRRTFYSEKRASQIRRAVEGK